MPNRMTIYNVRRPQSMRKFPDFGRLPMVQVAVVQWMILRLVVQDVRYMNQHNLVDTWRTGRLYRDCLFLIVDDTVIIK